MWRIAVALWAAALVGCGEHYSDLEARYKTTDKPSVEVFRGQSIVLTSTTRRGAYSFNEISGVAIEPAAIYLDVAFPFSLVEKPIRIPANEVAGCGKACFGKERQDSELYIPATGTTLGLKNIEMVEWCWANRIPIIPGKLERDWKYNSAPFPDKNQFDKQFKSRDEYSHLMHQSCLGY